MFQPIAFNIASLKALSADDQRAVIAAGLHAGLYDAETASAFAAECGLDREASAYAEQAGLALLA